MQAEGLPYEDELSKASLKDRESEALRHVFFAEREVGKIPGLPPMDPATDRAMICGSLAFNLDVKGVLEGFGLREGANSDPKEFVVEKAFVGEGI